MPGFKYALDAPIGGSNEIIVPVRNEEDIELLDSFFSNMVVPQWDFMMKQCRIKDSWDDLDTPAIRLTRFPPEPWNLAGSGWGNLNWYKRKSCYSDVPIIEIWNLFGDYEEDMPDEVDTQWLSGVL